MKVSEDKIKGWQKDAKTAYHTRAFEGRFDIYWRVTMVLRMDVPIPYAEYWEDAKTIKQAAWDAEALLDGEGK